MNRRPVLFQMPGTVLASTIVGNFLGLLLAGTFQSIYILTAGILPIERLNWTLWEQLSYSFGAGIFISYVAVPLSIVLMIVVTLVSWRFTLWHVALGTVFGLYLGAGTLGSVYWGVPVLSYCLATATCTCWLVWRRQQQLLLEK